MFDTTHSCCGSDNALKSYTECIAILLANAPQLLTENVSLDKAVGRVLAKDHVAKISVPSFNNSAMDGFAFAARSVEQAAPEHPVSLPIVGASIAGDSTGLSHLGDGLAVKIMTGAPMPEGTDTVLPVEAASWDHESLTFHSPYEHGKHVRRVGQDIMAGQTLLSAGTRIAPHHLPMACADGMALLNVLRRPKIAWISTGQEINDDFSKPLEPGHIYNATRIFGQEMAASLGLDMLSATTVRDTPQDFACALDEARDRRPDIILSTGGVSAGQYDFVRPVLEDLGAEILFHKARIKPAKPVLFARFPDGGLFFGLPGNPISTALAMRAFVAPLVRAMTDRAPETPLWARLGRHCQGAEGKTTFLMASAALDAYGTMTITPDAHQQSFQTQPFANSNAWIMIPEGTAPQKEGDLVPWLPFYPDHGGPES